MTRTGRAGAIATALMICVTLFGAQATGASAEAATAVAQATVSIRIIRAVTLKLDGSHNEDAPPARAAVLTHADGSRRPAKLIEFQ